MCTPQFASAGHLLNGQGASVAGGRWNPPGQFRTNHCSLSPGTAAEEAYRLFESKGLPRAIVGNRVIATIHYELQAVWDFSRIPEGLTGKIIREALKEEWGNINARSYETPGQCLGWTAYDSNAEGFLILWQMNAYVTIPNIHCPSLRKEDGEAAMEMLMNNGDQRSHELLVTFRDGYLNNSTVCKVPLARIRNTSSDRNFRNFLRQRANVLDGLNRHPKNCLHHYAAEIPIRAALHQYHPEVVLLLPRLEPIRQTS